MSKQRPGDWSLTSFDVGTHYEQHFITEKAHPSPDIDGHYHVARVKHLDDALLIVNAVAMALELQHVTAWIHDQLQEMTCDAGNPDGGSAASCEHCQMTAWGARIDALLIRAGKL